jgi:hypothetical protein
MFEQCTAMLDRVFSAYRQAGCPCAFPRFVQVTGFDFRAFGEGPVGCHVTELAIARALAAGGVFHAQHEGDRVENGTGVYRYRCGVCGTVVERMDDEFSINMRLSRLTFVEMRARPVGAPAAPRVPMPRGFFGFDAADIDRCASGFTVEGTFEDLERYLTALADDQPSSSAPLR